ncbi:hypothetical protein [Nonomuraea diastatica]|uniref:WD40 repeat domain-containing protein n=1 Tax=Nonomuraea diastatica TaxID=1848329 RepID=A0A4R4W8J5_9ACTN|nr:hypothetical protein [Nonomuraea diastatica]TDD11485.1 hypothetical protein E1294_45040 [Nonomuraea diastatica]
MFLAALLPAVLGVIFLHRIALDQDETACPALEAIAARLPEEPPRTRPAVLLAALLLPGLLYGTTVAANPLGWLEVSDHVTAPREVVPLNAEDRGLPVYPFSLQSVGVASGDRPTVHLADHDLGPRLLTCLDSRCGDLSLYRAAGDDSSVPVSAATHLPDGRTVVASWEWTDKEGRYRIRLRVCGDGTCKVTADAIRTLPRDRLVARKAKAVLVARPDGGSVVAYTEISLRDDADRETVMITTCADLACAAPVTHAPAKLNHPIESELDTQVLDLAIAPDGRPVIARYDVETGLVHVVSCAAPDCAKATVSSAGTRTTRDITRGKVGSRGLSVTVRRDGRPVIAYRETPGGVIRLINCRHRSCASADTVPLTGRDPDRHAPGLVIDHAGRVLVATTVAGRLTVYSCRETRCTATPIAKGDQPERLVMTLDPAGRPVIAWVDASMGEGGVRDWRLRITTPLNLGAA